MKLSALIAATVLVMPTAVSADITSVSSMIENCRGTKTNSPSRLYDQGVCMGIVHTVRTISAGSCNRPDINNTQAMAVFLKYADQHPELWHKPVDEIVFVALTTQWPCKGK